MANTAYYSSAGATTGDFTGESLSCYGVNTFSEATGNLTLTGATFYVYNVLIINNTGTNTLTGTPTVIMMNRLAQFNPVGTVTADVRPYRLANAHRLRHIA